MMSTKEHATPCTCCNDLAQIAAEFADAERYGKTAEADAHRARAMEILAKHIVQVSYESEFAQNPLQVTKFGDQCHCGAAKEWIIQRCTQRWVGRELQYEDFPTPEGYMTYETMCMVLKRVQQEYPSNEFRGHRPCQSTQNSE